MQARWKQILPFSLLFSVLTGSLIYYVLLPRIVVLPLRMDHIPSDSYIIPWARPSLSIAELERIPINDPPWDIDEVMSDALKLNITFTISIPNGTRIVPSTVYLGHDADYLYVGGKFRGMYKNPTSTQTVVSTNYFVILFDVANDGILTFPESGSRLSVALHENAGWHTGKVWSIQDQIWDGRWVLGDDVGLPVSTGGDSETEYDNSTGTVIMLFSRHLRKDGFYDSNALQMKAGERWVMGFILELAYSNGFASGAYQDFVDDWPQKTYPYTSDDSSGWPKLVIDLSNPPPEFST